MAKEMIGGILLENFYPGIENEETDVDLKSKVRIHVKKVAEWFYALLKKNPPWTNWTNDIYDAMRCIDHLPKVPFHTLKCDLMWTSFFQFDFPMAVTVAVAASHHNFCHVKSDFFNSLTTGAHNMCQLF